MCMYNVVQVITILQFQKLYQWNPSKAVSEDTHAEFKYQNKVLNVFSKTEQLLCYIDFIGSIEQTLFLHETSCKTHYFGNKNVF